MTDRKKPGVAFWASVLVVVLLAYPLSLGPACWISSHSGRGADHVFAIYSPLIFKTGRIAGNAFIWYSRVGAADGWDWFTFFDATGSRSFWGKL